MRFRYRKMNKAVVIAICVVLLILFAVLVLLAYQKDREQKAYLAQLAEQHAAKREAGYVHLSSDHVDIIDNRNLYSSESVRQGIIQGEILIDREEFVTNAEKNTVFNQPVVTCNVPEVEEGDFIILEFASTTENESSVSLEVAYGSSKVHVDVNQKQKKFFIPFLGRSGAQTISFRYDLGLVDTAPVTLGDVCLVRYGLSYPASYFMTGEYSTEVYDTINIEANNSLAQGQAAVSVENMLYGIFKGDLVVYQKDNDSLTEINRISGLGDTRDMCLSPDKKTIVVTSRGSGAYFVDISVPSVPVIASHYDTLELCTGVDTYQKYVFICSRYFGVEIVDISDPGNPRYVTNIQSTEASEYQDCCVDNGYLYVGLYANKRVDVYDIRDLSNIKLVSMIKLDGAGQGLTVKNGILYAATGRNDSSNPAESCYDYGYGMGNGLEIFDVTNPGSPILLSKEKMDGRSSLYPNDIWDVSVSGNYAFVSLMCGGLYIYDVTDPAMPLRVSVVNIVADTMTDKFSTVDVDTEVTPYRADLESHGCVTHTVVDDGCAYVIAPNMGIYLINGDWTKAEDKIEVVSIVGQPIEPSVGLTSGWSVEIFNTDSSVWAVAQLDSDHIILACGEGGIEVLDNDLNFVCSYPTEYSVKDIRVRGGLVYTAESEGGFCIYRYQNGSLTKLGSCNDSVYNSYYSSLEVSEDGKLAVVQAGYSKFRLIDCSDYTNPELVKVPTEDTVGAMYYRNVCIGSVAGKYLGISGRKGINWFYYDHGVQYLQNTTDLTGSEWIGLTAAGGQCILISTKGYRYFNPETGYVSKNHVLDSDYFKGKCVASDGVLVVTRVCEGKICVVDISDIDNPVIKVKFDTDYITDVPCLVEDVIYVPCRYDGLIKITPNS